MLFNVHEFIWDLEFNKILFHYVVDLVLAYIGFHAKNVVIRKISSLPESLKMCINS